jgi:acyl-coenzyme A thioesterase PaaI-like protein
MYLVREVDVCSLRFEQGEDHAHISNTGGIVHGGIASGILHVRVGLVLNEELGTLGMVTFHRLQTCNIG